MPFPPDNVIVDDFNRPDEGPPPTGWSGSIFATSYGLRVISNEVGGAQPFGSHEGYWLSPAGDVQEAFVTIVVMPGFDNVFRIHINLTGGGTAFPNGYMVQVTDKAPAADEISIYRLDAGVYTSLDTQTEHLGPGDRFGIRNRESAVTAIRLLSGGEWEEILSVEDTTYNIAGYQGLMIGHNVGRLDDFGCGNANVSSIPEWYVG